MKNVIIVILTVIILIFVFVLFQTDKKVAYEPWPETEPAHTTQTNNNPNGPNYTAPTNNNQTQTPTNPPATPSNLENTETPIYIKSIYQKNGKWWADVDYVTIWNDLQLIEYKINTGLCVLPNMTKQQALNYVQTADLQSGYFKDQNNEGCHVPEHPGDGGNIVNQNPLIRSFPFASNFKTINGCYTENDTTIQEYKNQVESFRTYSNGNLTNLNYSYGVFNTQGTYKRKAIIKNSEIETFDQINGCAG